MKHEFFKASVRGYFVGDPIVAACEGATYVYGGFLRHVAELVLEKTRAPTQKEMTRYCREGGAIRIKTEKIGPLPVQVKKEGHKLWAGDICYDVRSAFSRDYTVNAIQYRVSHSDRVFYNLELVTQDICDRALELDFYATDKKAQEKLLRMRTLWEQGYRPRNLTRFGDQVRMIVKLRCPKLTFNDDPVLEEIAKECGIKSC